MTIIIFPFAQQQDNIFEGQAGHQVWAQTGALSMAASYFFWWFLTQAFSVPLPSKVKVVVDFPHSISIKVLQKFLAWGTLIIVSSHMWPTSCTSWGPEVEEAKTQVDWMDPAFEVCLGQRNAIDTPCPPGTLFFF